MEDGNIGIPGSINSSFQYSNVPAAFSWGEANERKKA